VHKKRDAGDDAPRSLRVDYKVGWNEYKSEWVCFEHAGYARQKAVAWWKRRSADPVPDMAHDAVVIANHGGLAVATSITVRCVEGDPYERIIDWELGHVPESFSAGEADELNAEAIPF
jgi:DNA repair protein RadD